jgi:hypothetical protein
MVRSDKAMTIKINKILIKTAHFFGCRLKEEHIDDVTINIESDDFTELDMDVIHNWSSKKHTNARTAENDEYICDVVKNKAYAILKANPKINKRCINVKGVWLTFYKKNSSMREGSIVRTCRYLDGVLYLDISKLDRAAVKRHEAINDITE